MGYGLSRDTRAAMLEVLAGAAGDWRLDEKPVSPLALRAARVFVTMYGTAPIRIDGDGDVVRLDRVGLGPCGALGIRNPDRLEVRRFAVALNQPQHGNLVAAAIALDAQSEPDELAQVGA